MTKIEVVVAFAPVATDLANLHQEYLVFVRGPAHNGIPEEGGISYIVMDTSVMETKSLRGTWL